MAWFSGVTLVTTGVSPPDPNIPILNLRLEGRGSFIPAFLKQMVYPPSCQPAPSDPTLELVGSWDRGASAESKLFLPAGLASDNPQHHDLFPGPFLCQKITDSKVVDPRWPDLTRGWGSWCQCFRCLPFIKTPFCIFPQ